MKDGSLEILRWTLVTAVTIIFLSLPADSKDFSYNLHLWNEVSADQINMQTPFNPDNRWLDLPTWSNALVLAGEGSFTLNPKLKIGGGFYNRYDYKSGNSDLLRVKELYLTWSIESHWDITAGKRILKWGTGYAWTPTGVLDPHHDPRDPNDRLNQYEGKELIELRGTYGRHNITAVYSSPHLFSQLHTSSRDDQWALKFNSLARRLDYSLIASFGGIQKPNRYGANASYVIGQSLELHGEYAAQRGSRLLFPLSIAEEDPRITYTASPYGPLKEHDNDIYSKVLFGANYTFRSGWNVVVEYYHDREGLTPLDRQRFDTYVSYNESLAPSSGPEVTLPVANLLWTLQGLPGFSRGQDYMFARVNRSRIAGKWDVEHITIVSLRDGSSIWIPQVSYDFHERVGTYLRYTLYAGDRMSEFGSLPWRANWIIGLALRF